MNRLLNLCIPTYNRAACLEHMLKSIDRAVSDKNISRIKIYISDNASTDNTELVVNNFRNSSKLEVKYRKQNVNKGPLINLFEAFGMIEDKNSFFWLLGDDDEIASEALDKVIAEIDQQSFEILLLNRVICSKKLVPVKNDNYFNVKKDLHFKIKSDKDYRQYLKKVKTLDGLMCFISSIICGPQILSFIEKELEHDSFYKQNLFPHTYLLHKYIYSKKEVNIKYIYDPLILWRADNTSKEGDSNKIHSMVNYKNLNQIATTVLESKKELNSFLKVLRRTYTIRRHFGFINKSNQEEKRYHNYIFYLLNFDIFRTIGYKSLILLLPLARLIKKNTKVA